MIELTHGTDQDSLNLIQLFGRDASVQVDLGCGDGSFLQALAAETPETNFLGVERLLHRVRSSNRKAATLPNVRIIRAETLFLLRHLLAGQSITAFYLLFPDPWPKRRHHRRRLVSPEFLAGVHRCLIPGGFLFVATDHHDYFAAIRQLLQRTLGFKFWSGTCWNLPATTFERKFAAAGIPIHRVVLRKTSPVM